MMAQRKPMSPNFAGYSPAFVTQAPVVGSLAVGLGVGQSPVSAYDEGGGLGLSVNVAALPEEDGLASLSPDARLTELKMKRDQLKAQIMTKPDDCKTLLRLARACEKLREVPDFTAFARELCRQHPCAWKSVFRVFSKLELDRDGLLSVLQKAQQVDPLNPELCCALAKVEQRRSREWYEKALENDPLHHEALVAIADDHRKVQNYAEAVRFYQAAYQQRPTAKILYRLGECLLQDGRDEGREHLMQVLSDPDSTYHLHAAVHLQMSYTTSQQHDKALEFFDKAKELHASCTGSDPRLQNLMKHAVIFKAKMHLNCGQIGPAVDTLRPYAQGPTSLDERWADDMIDCTLGLAEILRGNLESAERHLAQAHRYPQPDVLVITAYLKQAQGDLEGAKALLSECLETSINARWRMGYVLLCQDQFEHAAQNLKKCLEQPTGAGSQWTYGDPEKGAAHFYLCVALHLRATADRAADRLAHGASWSSSGPAVTSPNSFGSTPTRNSDHAIAEEHFRKGHELLPDFAHTLCEVYLQNSSSSTATSPPAVVGTSPGGGSTRTLISGRPTSSAAAHGSMRFPTGSVPSTNGARFFTGAPFRIGMVDLTAKQANVLLWFAERCGVVRPMHQAASPPSMHIGRLQAPPSLASSHGGLITRVPPPRTSLPAGAREVVASPLSSGPCRPLAIGGSPISRQEQGSSQIAPFAVTPAAGGGTGSTPVISTPVPRDDSAKPSLSYTTMAGSTSTQLLGSASSMPLMGTASTAAPTSCAPSRDASDRDLHFEAPVSGAPSSGSTNRPTMAASVPTSLCTTSASVTVVSSEIGNNEDRAAFELSSRLPPQRVLSFSDFELGDCISHGECTIVHRGVLRDSSRLEVVVKMLHQKDCLRDDQAAAELLAEVAIIAELSHPRLVTFVGACLEPSRVALVTELAPGGNLHQALHVRHRHLSRNERFQLATELLEGVCYLHGQNPPIAHLDLKSMNLVLDESGQHLQICDFGLARVLGDKSRYIGTESQEGQGPDRPPSRGGSPRYMSPECYDSNLGALTEKADVWSSGCIIIEIFGETLPYAECSNVQQILKLMLVDRCGPSIPANIEASVQGVIACTLAFEALERLNIAQVLQKFQEVAGHGISGVPFAGESKCRFVWKP